jgi:hypothetical protein
MGTAPAAVLRHPPALTNGAIAYLIAANIAVPKQGRSAGIRFALHHLTPSACPGTTTAVGRDRARAW